MSGDDPKPAGASQRLSAEGAATLQSTIASASDPPSATPSSITAATLDRTKEGHQRDPDLGASLADTDMSSAASDSASPPPAFKEDEDFDTTTRQHDSTDSVPSNTTGNPPPRVPDRNSDYHILNIAQELFEHIIEQDGVSNDLSALRLTCKDASNKSQRAFVRENFKQRSVLMTSTRSLRNAIEIADHEAFGPALMKLRIFTNTMHHPEEHQHSLFRQMSSRDRADHHRMAYKDQETLQEENGDLQLLSELFNRLQGLAQHIEISVDRNTDLLGASHYHQDLLLNNSSHEELYNYYNEQVAAHGNKSFYVILEALSKSGLHFEKFKIEQALIFEDPGFLDLSTLGPQKLVCLKHAFRNLKHLQLFSFSDGHNDSDDKALGLCEALSQLPYLETLHLIIQEPCDPFDDACAWHLWNSLQQCRFYRLRELKMTGVTLAMSKLVAFISAQASLKRLNLSPDMMFLDDGNVLSPYDTGFIRDALREVKLEEVWHGDVRVV